MTFTIKRTENIVILTFGTPSRSSRPVTHSSHYCCNGILVKPFRRGLRFPNEIFCVSINPVRKNVTRGKLFTNIPNFKINLKKGVLKTLQN